MFRIGPVEVVPVGILAQVIKAKSLFQATYDSMAWEWDHGAASMLLVYSSANRATVVEAVQLSTPLSICDPNATTTYALSTASEQNGETIHRNAKFAAE